MNLLFASMHEKIPFVNEITYRKFYTDFLLLSLSVNFNRNFQEFFYQITKSSPSNIQNSSEHIRWHNIPICATISNAWVLNVVLRFSRLSNVLDRSGNYWVHKRVLLSAYIFEVETLFNANWRKQNSILLPHCSLHAWPLWSSVHHFIRLT